MAKPEERWSCTSTDDSIIVSHPSSDSTLTIGFKRTIRVPDNDDTSLLPPSVGSLPLFKVQDYENKLPKAIASKGGVFFSMHQREAMWMSFKANMPFMIKVYAGDVNAISGEHYAEDLATKSRRQERRSQGMKIQDYVVTPDQLWLDGFATSPGVVKQFVAMPLGSGYSAEAQMTGHERLGGLQIEITPFAAETLPRVSEGFQVFITTLTGRTFAIPCSFDTTITQLKWEIWRMEGIPPDQQRLIHGGKQLEDQRHFADYKILNESVIHLILRLRGGGPGPKGVGLAAGGKIRQVIHKDYFPPSVWDRDATMPIRIHIFNSEDFELVTGQAPPPCPITAKDYAKAGFPFFKMYEENSKISGQFDKLKSINAIEQEKGLAAGPEAAVKPSVINLDKHGHAVQGVTKDTAPCGKMDGIKHLTSSDESECSAKFDDPQGLINPAGALRDFRCVRDLELELKDLSLDGSED